MLVMGIAALHFEEMIALQPSKTEGLPSGSLYCRGPRPKRGQRDQPPHGEGSIAAGLLTSGQIQCFKFCEASYGP